MKRMVTACLFGLGVLASGFANATTPPSTTYTYDDYASPVVGAFSNSYAVTVLSSSFETYTANFVNLPNFSTISDFSYGLFDSASHYIASGQILAAGAYNFIVSGSGTKGTGFLSTPGFYSAAVTITPVPEPSELMMLTLGLGVIGYSVRRRSNRNS